VSTPLTLKELAESMGTDAPAATVIVNALEEDGLVKREPHPDDRRAKVVSLTPAGKKLVAAGQAVDEEAPAMFASLRDSDVTELARIIAILRANSEGG
jgi:DNA-binding MarR family transcriptional regulator